tara:strand:- start:46142 stop:46870 length:729 start_codon:yes stop_codon:yes gene_type:complete
MLSIFRRKPIRFWSTYPGVVDCHPIIPAHRLERAYGKCPHAAKQKHASKCPALKQLGSTGWIVPMPCDVKIITNGDMETVDWKAPTLLDTDNGFVSVHDGTQSAASAPPHSMNSVIKIGTTWRVSAPKDVVFIQSPVLYNGEKRFTSALGIFDPRRVPQLNAQLYWHVLEGETLIEAGTPMMQLIPMMRESLRSFDYFVEDASHEDYVFEEKLNYNMSSKFDIETPTVMKNNQKIIENHYGN